MENLEDIVNKTVELEHESLDFGFYWPDLRAIIEQIKSEADEVEEAVMKLENISKSEETHLKMELDIKEEFGDLIQAVIFLSSFLGININEVLYNANNKYSNRLNALKNICKEKNINSLKGYDIKKMMEIWQEAKELCYNTQV